MAVLVESDNPRLTTPKTLKVRYYPHGKVEMLKVFKVDRHKLTGYLILQTETRQLMSLRQEWVS